MENFCNNPTKHTLKYILPNIDDFYTIAKQCVKDGVGNQQMANDVIGYIQNRRYVCDTHMGKCDVVNKDKSIPYGNNEYFSLEECKLRCVVDSCKKNRVRTLIPYLKYGPLKKAKIVPNTSFFTKIVKKGGNFPKIVRKTGYAWLGVFVDELLKIVLTKKDIPTTYDLKKVYGITMRMINTTKVTTVDDITNELDYFIGICATMISIFFDDDLLFDTEISYGPITGHPDIISGDTVYDVKTSGMFGRMRISSIFQVLMYYTLCRINYMDHITHIGLVLPAQGVVVKYDLSKWDWRPFWMEMVKATRKIKVNDPRIMMSYSLFIRPRIGSHIPKVDGTVWKGITPILRSNNAYQIFLSGPRSATVNLNMVDIQKSATLIKTNDTKLYIHAPYIFNIASVHDDDFVLNGMIKQLLLATEIGAKGVVVHIGKQMKLTKDKALDNMRVFLTKLSKFASVGCKLLLETSVGAGSEMLWKMDDFADFYFSLSSEVRKVTGICVDTCHVFAAGYQPIEALTILLNRGITVDLFHFNDSKCELDSHRDRHAAFGTGMINIEELVKVALYALENKIDILSE